MITKTEEHIYGMDWNHTLPVLEEQSPVSLDQILNLHELVPNVHVFSFIDSEIPRNSYSDLFSLVMKYIQYSIV